MDFHLADHHQHIRRTGGEFAEAEMAPVAEELDRDRRVPNDLVRQLRDLNLIGIPFPKRHGGAVANTLAYATAVEELTPVDSPLATTMSAHASLDM